MQKLRHGRRAGKVPLSVGRGDRVVVAVVVRVVLKWWSALNAGGKLG